MDAIGVDGDRAAVGRDEPGGVGGVENGVAGNVELGERLDAEKAGAVRGNADGGMLFEHHHVVPALRQLAGGHQSGRARADDYDVTQMRTSVLATTGFPCAMHANPK